MAYTLQQLLIESAQRFPDNVSVSFEQETLTYKQLDSLSNQLARSLQQTGLRKGDRVGIYLHKSLSSVISIFGILKAGGVYVPLDPNAPTKRLAFITRNCDIRILVTSGNKLSNIPEYFNEGTPVESIVLMDEDHSLPVEVPDNVTVIKWESVLSQSQDAFPDPSVIDNDLAYILYTSGSTGNPKGVMISHQTIFLFINWCYDTFNISPEDRVTSHAPLHFDLSTFDIFVTIKAGAAIVIIPEKLSIFPPRLTQFLQEEKITVTYLVPSILSLMVNYGNLEGFDLSKLRLVLFAGEVFPIKYLRELVSTVPHAEYYNLYGPTETNVCTYYKVQPEDVDAQRTQPVPIGKACGNIEVFAVDDNGQIVTEPGIEGELWVRGSCVAQGYWGDYEKTSTSFVVNPYQPNYEEIVYRTGDIVILHEDLVNWLFIGRQDHMIKSRGYRIEIGDIETAIYSHMDVNEAAVVPIQDDLLGNRIIAFVVPVEGSSVYSEDLESYLLQQLPRYMVPESINILDALPKTSTGKIDRQSLAAAA